MPLISDQWGGPEENCAKTQLFRAAPGLGDGIIHTVGRNHAGANEAGGIFSAKIVKPVVVGTGYCCGKTGVHVIDHQSAQTPLRIEHRQFYTFDVHGLELNLGGPAVLGMAAIDLQIVLEIAPASRVIFPRGFSRPFSAVRVDHAQVSYIVAGESSGSARLIFDVDIPVPTIHRFHDVHVAVNDFESIPGREPAFLIEA